MNNEMKYAYVAVYDKQPIIVTHTKEDMEQMLAEYTKGTLVSYKAHNPKYPDDLEGWYTYHDSNMNEDVDFTIYCVEYKRENNEGMPSLPQDDYNFDVDDEFSDSDTCPVCQAYDWSYHYGIDKMKCGDCGHEA